MKKMCMVMLVSLGLFGLISPVYAGWGFGGGAKVNVQYGNLDTATVGTIQYFRPNGSVAAATTVTASTVVPSKVYVETVILNWKDEDIAGQFTLWDTPGTTLNADARKVREFVADASAADLLNNTLTLDFTNHGSNSGIWFKSNPAVLVDSGLNTPVVTILYRFAPQNKVQP